jgi:hypothetical protein
MALYTLYSCQPSGRALTFDTIELPDDAAAFVQSVCMLEQHSTAAYVTVWCCDRHVCVTPNHGEWDHRRSA